MEKLPKTFKKKWLAALRSGKYKQGKGKLESSIDNTYCCLGVACKISDPNAKIIGRSLISTVYFNHEEFSELRVPKILRGEADSNPMVRKLINMNDGDAEDSPLSFEEIADWIETNL